MDPLDAEIRQVYFFDTPDLSLNRRGIVVRARRVQGKDGDTVVKRRPVVPAQLPKKRRKTRGFKVEVDAILEHRRGHVVGIEVKAASTVRADDFAGLRKLSDRLGDDFLAGIILYTGASTLPFGPKLRAMPVSALWQLDGQ